MKTTSSSLYRSMQFNIAKSRSDLDKLYLQVSDGKQVSVASDDPAAIRAIHSSRSQITMNERYIENIETAQDGMDIADGYLGSIEDVMQRAKEITTAAVNGGKSDADLETYANEVASLQAQLLDIANARVDGKYLFAGYANDSEPFGGDPVVYSGTSDAKMIESGPGEMIQSNIPGDALFSDPLDVFAELAALETNLRANDTTALNGQLDTLEDATNQVRTQRSLMGNNNARLEDSKSLLEDAKLQMQSTLSRYEDADLTEVISEMEQAEQSLEAALSISARVGQLTLLDYL